MPARHIGTDCPGTGSDEIADLYRPLHVYRRSGRGSSLHREPFRDKEGNLYGTTNSGGGGILPAGTVFKVDTTGLEIVLYSFTGGSSITVERQVSFVLAERPSGGWCFPMSAEFEMQKIRIFKKE